jgi:hypothetical protein
MRRRDFLHKDAETPLCEHYMAAGAVCSLSTNCEQLLVAARHTFLPAELPPDSVDFSLRLWVDDADRAQPPWPKPYVRGLDHLVFLGVDTRSSMLADLRTRRVIGRVSAAMATDSTHWKRIIFPMLLSILAGSVGLVELHASCVARDQRGLLLLGPSRSGKSTLAMALTEAGFRFLSDDRTFCSLRRDELLAWSLPRPLKLRHEAAAWFEAFRDKAPTDTQNGEPVFYHEPDSHFRQHNFPACAPKAVIYLERQSNPGFHIRQMTKSEMKSNIEHDLLAEDPAAIQKQEQILDNLLALPCWRLRYGGRPQVIAEQIASSFLSLELNDSAYRRQGWTT